MFRARRYRVLFVFAAAFVLAFFHFARSRDWSAPVIETTPEVYPPGSASSNASPDSKPEYKPHIPPAIEQSNKIPPAAPDNSVPEAPLPDKIKSPVGPNSGSKEDKIKTEPEKVPVKGTSDSSKDVGAGGKGPSSTTGTDSPAKDDTAAELEEIDRGGSGRQSAKRPESGARWKKFPERFPIPADELIKLPKEQAKTIPKLQAKAKDESSANKQERVQQLSTIKAEFKHAWEGYKKAAMGHDELKPLTNVFDDPFNGWGATLVDSLDTLWIMELKEEFSEAVDAVKKIDFTTSPRNQIPVFETVIRYLGGLLGAYDISGHRYPVLLEKAEELAEILIGIFDTPNRMPVLYYNWHPDHVARRHRASASANLAEIGSLSLEFTRLAQLTKQDKYYDAVARITNELEDLQDSSSIPGLWPMYVNAQGCAKYQGPTPDTGIGSPSRANSPAGREYPTPAHRAYSAPTDAKSYVGLVSRRATVDLSQAEPAPYSHGSTKPSEEKCDGGLRLPTARRHNKYSLGGSADSTYEYLPKEYLLLGGANDQYKTMYKKAMDAARKHLVFQPMVKGHRDLRFMAATKPLELERQGKLLQSDMVYEGTHLTCFVGGMVAVGAKAFGIEADMDLAYKLTDGCVWAYESTTTGMMPESFHLFPCPKDSSCEWDEERIKADTKRVSGGLGSDADAQFRNGESAYGQRVKMNTQVKPQGSEPTGAAVPIPMPGSMNPHDSDKLYKRDSFEASKSTVPVAMPTGNVDVKNRDTVRGPLNPVSSQADHTDQTLPPAGMVKIPSPEYLLRPEAIESVFIMFRLTGDDYWRRKGWKMFEAIIKHSKTELAHAAIKNVNAQKATQKDSMESFWLAETLKYFYLLFSDPSVVDLDKYVLNTEAHPFLRPL